VAVGALWVGLRSGMVTKLANGAESGSCYRRDGAQFPPPAAAAAPAAAANVGAGGAAAAAGCSTDAVPSFTRLDL